MTVEASEVSTLTFTRWRDDVVAGLVVGILALPICLSAGVLVFTPLGPDFVAEGAAAGLYGAIVAGGIAALVATSSFVITCPRAMPSLVLAGLVTTLLVNPAFVQKPEVVLAAAALCVFLPGLWQILFGLFRVTDIIKFTPHPVFAGFVNGVGLLIVIAQIRPFFVGGGGTVQALPKQPFLLAFVVGLALLAVFYGRLTKKLALPAWAAKVPERSSFSRLVLSPSILPNGWRLNSTSVRL
jgi:SulP family sulfate permease